MARKWIVVDNTFIMGNVDFHMDLVPKSSISSKYRSVAGGGFWHREKDGDTTVIWLFGKSEAFGQCSKIDVELALEEGVVPTFLSSCKIMFSTSDDFDKVLTDSVVVHYSNK